MKSFEQTTERKALWQAVMRNRVVAIMRLTRTFPLPDLAEALHEGGIRVIEFPLTTPGSLAAVRTCRERYGDVVVGVGTVHSYEDARRSLDAGAQFLASYGFDEHVVRAAGEHGALALPGAMTPTEIATAWRAGADAVKVFPAYVSGPGYIAHLQGPLGHIPLLPSGGIASADVPLYLRAGAAAVGVGDLLDPAAIEARDWAAITASARTLVAACRDDPQA